MVMRVSSSWLRCISFKVAPSPMLWSSLTPLIGQGYSQSYRYSGQLRSTCNCTLMDDSYRYGGQLRSTLMGVVVEPSRP